MHVSSTVAANASTSGAFQSNRAAANLSAYRPLNDLIAAGIVLRLTADGVDVPGAVSVIGFDNTLIAPVVTPPITSIRIPRSQLGQVAVLQLLGRDTSTYRNPADTQVMQWLAEYDVRCEEESMPNVTLVDTSLIVRRSVGDRRAA